MSSGTTFSLISTQSSTYNTFFKTLKPPIINFLHTRKPQKLPFQFKKSLIFSSKLSLNQNTHQPVSNLPISTTGLSSENDFLTQLVKKSVLFLVGSFIFLGFLKSKPCLALQSETVTSDSKLEEKRETQKAKSENEVMYEKLVKSEPSNVDALKVVFYEKMRRGKTKRAVRYLEKLIEIEPKEVEWRLLKALCYEMMGKLEQARRLFIEILEENPLLLRALHGLAMVMHKNNEGQAVFEMLSKARELARRENRVTEQRNIEVLTGQMHIVKGELKEALKKFQYMVDENPRDFRPYLCQGIIYSLMDKKEEAAKQFEIYWSLVPEEFPQRGFLDDVVLAAKTNSKEQLAKEFGAVFSNRD